MISFKIGDSVCKWQECIELAMSKFKKPVTLDTLAFTYSKHGALVAHSAEGETVDLGIPTAVGDCLVDGFAEGVRDKYVDPLLRYFFNTLLKLDKEKPEFPQFSVRVYGAEFYSDGTNVYSEDGCAWEYMEDAINIEEFGGCGCGSPADAIEHTRIMIEKLLAGSEPENDSERFFRCHMNHRGHSKIKLERICNMYNTIEHDFVVWFLDENGNRVEGYHVKDSNGLQQCKSFVTHAAQLDASIYIDPTIVMYRDSHSVAVKKIVGDVETVIAYVGFSVKISEERFAEKIRDVFINGRDTMLVHCLPTLPEAKPCLE